VKREKHVFEVILELACEDHDWRMKNARINAMQSIREQKAKDDAQLWDKLPGSEQERIRQALLNYKNTEHGM
jgi:hypothetical protein